MCKDPSINYDTTRWQVCAGTVTKWTHTSSSGSVTNKNILCCWFISAWTLHTTLLRHLRHSRFLSFSTSGLRRRRYDKTPTTFNSYSSLHWISQMSARFPLTGAGVMSFTNHQPQHIHELVSVSQARTWCLGIVFAAYTTKLTDPSKRNCKWKSLWKTVMSQINIMVYHNTL